MADYPHTQPKDPEIKSLPPQSLHPRKLRAGGPQNDGPKGKGGRLSINPKMNDDMTVPKWTFQYNQNWMIFSYCTSKVVGRKYISLWRYQRFLRFLFSPTFSRMITNLTTAHSPRQSGGQKNPPSTLQGGPLPVITRVPTTLPIFFGHLLGLVYSVHSIYNDQLGAHLVGIHYRKMLHVWYIFTNMNTVGFFRQM